MLVSVFASGSSGNCLLLRDNNTNILIDAGISMRRMQGFLSSYGLTWRNIGGVLITHEHSDHISGLPAAAGRGELTIFAPHTVANRLLGKYPLLQDQVRVIPTGDSFSLGSLRIRAFHTPHDTDESVGYRVEGSAVFAVATDMGHVTEEIRQNLTGADCALIEANHDLDLLRNGPYPFVLKRRILSERGHLSNDDCAQLAAFLTQNGTSQIILGHLSRENNRPALALAAVEAALAGSGAKLFCAPPLGPLEIAVTKETSC